MSTGICTSNALQPLMVSKSCSRCRMLLRVGLQGGSTVLTIPANYQPFRVKLLSASSTHCHTSLPSASRNAISTTKGAQSAHCSNHAPPHRKPGTNTINLDTLFTCSLHCHHSQRHDVSPIWISTCSTLVQRRCLCGVRSSCGQNRSAGLLLPLQSATPPFIKRCLWIHLPSNETQQSKD